MLEHDGQNLEQALARTEADAAASIKAAQTVMSTLRKFHTAAKVGNLKDVRASMENAEKALVALGMQLANAKGGWNFDEERYFADGLYSKEVIATGQQMGVRIFERDDRLYCYPALIQISPKDKAVFIDKKRENRLRPSALVTYLKNLQGKPPRFRAETFLNALYDAYGKAVAMRKREFVEMAPVVSLLDIYGLFTLLPGQKSDYTSQEFARDIYLLHKSGVAITRNGARVSFPASTGTRAPSRTISVITEAGEHRRYYGVSFTPASREA